MENCLEFDCNAKIKVGYYCNEHAEKITEFIVGNRSKGVVDGLIRRIQRRKPCWLILDGERIYIDRFGWATGRNNHLLGHVKNILAERGYEHVK